MSARACRFLPLLAICLIAALWSPPARADLFDRKDPPSDYEESEIVVIGRVTAVERFRIFVPAEDPLKGRGSVAFQYFATITVGEVIKGDTKKDADLLFWVGGEESRDEDNKRPSLLWAGYKTLAWHLQPGGVYLLYLNGSTAKHESWATAEVRRKGEWTNAGLLGATLWKPRSDQWSIHRLRHLPPSAELYYDPKGEAPAIPLKKFIAETKAGRHPGWKDEKPEAASAPAKETAAPEKSKD